MLLIAHLEGKSIKTVHRIKLLESKNIQNSGRNKLDIKTAFCKKSEYQTKTDSE